jgi:hypothetical protein
MIETSLVGKGVTNALVGGALAFSFFPFSLFEKKLHYSKSSTTTPALTTPHTQATGMNTASPVPVESAYSVQSTTTTSQQAVVGSIKTKVQSDPFALTTPSTSSIVPNTVTHVETPEAVKAIYMSQCYGSSKTLRKKLIDLADETEVNSIVIDLKDYSGTVSYKSNVALKGGGGCTISDFKELITEMHAHTIYVIGRLTVFQDPLYTKQFPEEAVHRVSDKTLPWKDGKGLAFVDVGSKKFHEYIVRLAREAHSMGVDEINYDYIRYPSDGNMKDTYYTHSVGSNTSPDKAIWLEKFFAYLDVETRGSVESNSPHKLVTSADLFGMVTTNYDDLNIGQVMERAAPYFDYIAPMTYPSHYPKGFNGYKDPNKNVYGVMKYCMDKAIPRMSATTTKISLLNAATTTLTTSKIVVEKIGTTTATTTKVTHTTIYAKESYPATKIRPWVQDFNYGGIYGPKEIKDQFQAIYDSGATSWMIWAPSNRYTRAGLLDEKR